MHSHSIAFLQKSNRKVYSYPTALISDRPISFGSGLAFLRAHGVFSPGLLIFAFSYLQTKFKEIECTP